MARTERLKEQLQIFTWFLFMNLCIFSGFLSVFEEKRGKKGGFLLNDFHVFLFFN